MEYNPKYTNVDWNIIKSKFPNAKTVIFGGGDIKYYGGPNCINWPIDLFIENDKEMVSYATRFPAEHFYWNISETTIQEIQNTELCKEKTKWGISLCREASDERREFFSKLKDNGYPVSFNLKLYNHESIYQEFAKHYINLGHSTPVHSGKSRSMKGYREWISCHLNTILIYDDYPDIIDIGTDIIPIYRYLNENDVIDLTNILRMDTKLYNKYIKNQKEWSINNSLEKQLDRILKKYNYV